MKRPIAATLACIISLSGIEVGQAQQFEKNSAANIFGADGPKVPVYESNRPQNNERERSESDDSNQDPRVGATAFLEEVCKQVGPKSSACDELAAIRGERGSAATRGLGFDPGAAGSDTSGEEDSEFNDE